MGIMDRIAEAIATHNELYDARPACLRVTRDEAEEVLTYMYDNCPLHVPMRMPLSAFSPWPPDHRPHLALPPGTKALLVAYGVPLTWEE